MSKTKLPSTAHCRGRVTTNGAAAPTTLAAWQPHLVLVNMDLDGGRIASDIPATAAAGTHLPMIAFTRRAI